MSTQVTLSREQWEELRDCADRKVRQLDGAEWRNTSLRSNAIDMRFLARETLKSEGESLTASVGLREVVQVESMEVHDAIRSTFKQAGDEIVAAGAR